jgi:hypothetical protein
MRHSPAASLDFKKRHDPVAFAAVGLAINPPLLGFLSFDETLMCSCKRAFGALPSAMSEYNTNAYWLWLSEMF